MMIEETKYDDSIECHHSYDERCHTTYTTDFEPQQVNSYLNDTNNLQIWAWKKGQEFLKPFSFPKKHEKRLRYILTWNATFHNFQKSLMPYLRFSYIFQSEKPLYMTDCQKKYNPKEWLTHFLSGERRKTCGKVLFLWLVTVRAVCWKS